MIRVEHLTKTFEGVPALKDITCTIPDRCIYGLVGTNGAGKSTLLRVLSGVYAADEGEVTLNDAPIYEHPETKKDIVFVADDLYLPPRWTLQDTAKTFAAGHPGFSEERFLKLMSVFNLDPTRRAGTYSKGMKRIAAACLALACPGKVFLFDETFDGMDPVVRTGMKKLLAEEIYDRDITVLVTSHSLRELEGFADILAMIHKGNVVLEEDTNTLKSTKAKVHTAFPGPISKEALEEVGVPAEQFRKTGSTVTFYSTLSSEELTRKLEPLSPLFLDTFPLTLEEVFTAEAAALGYDFDWKEEDHHA